MERKQHQSTTCDHVIRLGRARTPSFSISSTQLGLRHCSHLGSHSLSTFEQVLRSVLNSRLTHRLIDATPPSRFLPSHNVEHSSRHQPWATSVSASRLCALGPFGVSSFCGHVDSVTALLMSDNEPMFQVFLIGFVCFCTPGMFNALSNLGAGGAQDVALVDTTNGLLYGMFCITGFVAGSVHVSDEGAVWTRPITYPPERYRFPSHSLDRRLRLPHLRRWPLGIPGPRRSRVPDRFWWYSRLL